MAKAKAITDEALSRLLDDVAAESRMPERDFAIILLSCKAGLRACEIAGLAWTNVTDVMGNLIREIEVPKHIAKKGHARTVPMHPMIFEALEILRGVYGRKTVAPGQFIQLPVQAKGKAPVILSFGDGEAMSPNNLQKYLGRLYRRHGLDASSHSGRRTVITKLARMANDHGCSLFDVQAIAGHKYVSTTEGYVERSENTAKMMEAL